MLQVFLGMRSERQLVEQTQNNMLYRRFIGLSMDDAVCVPTVFSKNRERSIEHDAVVPIVNEVVHTGKQKRWLSGELRRGRHTDPGVGEPQESGAKDGRDDAADSNSGGSFQGEKRSNETKESKTDPSPGSTAAARRQ